MATNHRRKRKLVIDGRTYRWHVARDFDAGGMPALNVHSDDKRFIVQYHLAEPEGTRHVVVIGTEFAQSIARGGYRRYRCPQFAHHDVVAPADVRALIEWCHRADSDAVEVDASGVRLTSAPDLSQNVHSSPD